MKCIIKFGTCIGMIQGDRQFNHVALCLTIPTKNWIGLNWCVYSKIFRWECRNLNAGQFFVFQYKPKFWIFNKRFKAFVVIQNSEYFQKKPNKWLTRSEFHIFYLNRGWAAVYRMYLANTSFQFFWIFSLDSNLAPTSLKIWFILGTKWLLNLKIKILILLLYTLSY